MGQVKFLATGGSAGVAAGQLSLQGIREALTSLMGRRAEDPNLYYLDGLDVRGSGR